MKKELVNPMFFVFMSAVLIVLFYFLLPGFNLIPCPYNLAGILIALFGFSIMGKTRRLFSKHETTIMIKESTVLMKEGTFSLSRNPMYVGMFILLLGFAMCFGNLFSVLTPVVFIIMIAIVYVPKEEKLLQNTFGEEYEAYKMNVRKWI